MKTKNLRPTSFHTMHANDRPVVAVSFVTSDKEYIFQLPAQDAKRLVVGLAHSIKLAEVPKVPASQAVNGSEFHAEVELDRKETDSIENE